MLWPYTPSSLLWGMDMCARLFWRAATSAYRWLRRSGVLSSLPMVVLCTPGLIISPAPCRCEPEAPASWAVDTSTYLLLPTDVACRLAVQEEVPCDSLGGTQGQRNTYSSAHQAALKGTRKLAIASWKQCSLRAALAGLLK